MKDGGELHVTLEAVDLREITSCGETRSIAR